MRQVFWVVMAGAVLLGGCEAAAMKEYANLRNSYLDTAKSAGAEGAEADKGGEEARPVAVAAEAGEPATRAEGEQRRIIIYQAALRVTVADVAGAQGVLLKKAEALGGYLQEMDATAITLRVPAARFAEAVEAVDGLGEVTGRTIKANDITEEMRDLQIRLGNAEKVRERLLALADKSTKMEDTIKIEQELERVTETIELLKGQIAYLGSHAAFSTVRVEMNSPLPQKQLVAVIPFAWVRELGDGLVASVAEASSDVSKWRSRNTRFELPKNYIRYYERDGVTEAMSAEGVLVRLVKHDNYDGGDLGFWSAMARRALVENRGVAVVEEMDVELKSGNKGRMIVGTRAMAGKPHGYLVALVTTKGKVWTFEAWGEKEKFLKDLPELKRAAGSLEIGKW